jgi:hypothetical protein
LRVSGHDLPNRGERNAELIRLAASEVASSAAGVATAAHPAQGRAGAMTVIAILHPFHALRWVAGRVRLAVIFFFTKIPDRRRIPRHTPRQLRPVSLQFALAQLGVIHDVHFALIRRFPDHGQPPERIGQHLMLFESNYDGGFDDYIDAFSAIVPRWMKRFWGSSYGFPGPLPVTPFKDYIRRNEFGADHWYHAHPGASSRMINSALALARSEAPFRAEAAELSPADFEARYRQLLASVQAEL